eukprot:6172243-Pleurochrysis_carterae.AAC.1
MRLLRKQNHGKMMLWNRDETSVWQNVRIARRWAHIVGLGRSLDVHENELETHVNDEDEVDETVDQKKSVVPETKHKILTCLDMNACVPQSSSLVTQTHTAD